MPTVTIDTQSEPGSYREKFVAAETYDRHASHPKGHPCLIWNRCGLTKEGFLAGELERWPVEPHERPARCYRDRKAHDRLIATTNAIRDKLGWEPIR